ncbi:hypothetical protein V6N13_079206 [Hibiscus sabdariffa]|uniref:DC1 domain-containing protein n=1 Tax=Hibiscus sabdariffa TaxID=183260 RepID=A0ABR2RQN1_9ROSI
MPNVPCFPPLTQNTPRRSNISATHIHCHSSKTIQYSARNPRLAVLHACKLAQPPPQLSGAPDHPAPATTSFYTNHALSNYLTRLYKFMTLLIPNTNSPSRPFRTATTPVPVVHATGALIHLSWHTPVVQSSAGFPFTWIALSSYPPLAAMAVHIFSLSSTKHQTWLAIFVCHPSTPKTINHESHPHPLTLTKSPLEFELNSDQDVYNSEAEFYCDVCEERRHKRESVYCCADCKFIAELKCITPNVTVLPLIPKTEHVQQVPPASFSDNVDDGDDDDERSPFCKVIQSHKIRTEEE